MTSEQTLSRSYWGVLEAMGRTVRYGLIEEHTQCGVLSYTVHVPATSHNIEFSEQYGAAGIFRITKCTESQARQLAEQNNKFELDNSPIWDLVRKQQEQMEVAMFDDEIPF